MTVHWIDPSTLQCCKAAISCTRLVGRHTYDILASKMNQFIAATTSMERSLLLSLIMGQIL